jgi:hypothetical protein
MSSEFDGISGDAKATGESNALSVFPPPDFGETSGESSGLGSGLEAIMACSYGGGAVDGAEEVTE